LLSGTPLFCTLAQQIIIIIIMIIIIIIIINFIIIIIIMSNDLDYSESIRPTRQRNAQTLN
jgi:flagellar basal body-associated protein FliL